MDPVYELIQKIREMYGIYIGKKSLERLKSFVDGYMTRMEEAQNQYSYFLDGFQKYIESRYEINSDHNWSSIIQFFSITEEEAFDRFYELLDDYIEENHAD